MRSLYESILDDEDILIGSVDDNLVCKLIYDKLIKHEELTKEELKWTNEKVGIFKVDREQLKKLIISLKIKDISLNWLDVSGIDDMYYMFYDLDFNGDISKWDVSKVKNMSGMFYNSEFNGDISKWDVSKVKDMSWMFYNSNFNRDISKWDVSKVKNMNFMFARSYFNHDISNWNTNNVTTPHSVFMNCFIRNKYKPKKLQNE